MRTYYVYIYVCMYAGIICTVVHCYRVRVSTYILYTNELHNESRVSSFKFEQASMDWLLTPRVTNWSDKILHVYLLSRTKVHMFFYVCSRLFYSVESVVIMFRRWIQSVVQIWDVFDVRRDYFNFVEILSWWMSVETFGMHLIIPRLLYGYS